MPRSRHIPEAVRRRAEYFDGRTCAECGRVINGDAHSFGPFNSFGETRNHKAFCREFRRVQHRGVHGLVQVPVFVSAKSDANTSHGELVVRLCIPVKPVFARDVNALRRHGVTEVRVRSFVRDSPVGRD